MIVANVSGNEVLYNEITKQWHFIDGTISDKNNIRGCVRCGKLPTVDGHDSCIANLPGVKNACCGHGVEDGYIQFENGLVLRGRFSVDQDIKTIS